jgi:hypothetical protein
MDYDRSGLAGCHISHSIATGQVIQSVEVMVVVANVPADVGIPAPKDVEQVDKMAPAHPLPDTTTCLWLLRRRVRMGHQF